MEVVGKLHRLGLMEVTEKQTNKIYKCNLSMNVGKRNQGLIGCLQKLNRACQGPEMSNIVSLQHYATHQLHHFFF